MAKCLSANNEMHDKEIFQGLLQESENDPKLRVTAVESTPACQSGDNFMSHVTRHVVDIETVKINSTKKHYLMKKQLSNLERRDALRCAPAFKNEALAYNSVIPLFESFSKTKLPFPECPYASNDIVILNDLQPLGFKMADRMKGLNLEQASIAIKELGRFHGISYAMKLSDPVRFSTVKSMVSEFLYEQASGFDALLENVLETAIFGLKRQSFEHNKNEFNDIISKLESFRGSVFEKMFQIIRSTEPLTVLCHGDFYVNNILFRCDENETPEEVAFVDLQVFRYASLTTDLHYFLCSSLEKGLLLSHYDHLLEIYYDAMNKEIRRILPDNYTLKLEDIKKEMEKNSFYGVISAFMLLPAITAKPNTINTERSDLPTMEETMEFLSPEYFDRMKDFLLTFHKFGFL